MRIGTGCGLFHLGRRANSEQLDFDSVASWQREMQRPPVAQELIDAVCRIGCRTIRSCSIPDVGSGYFPMLCRELTYAATRGARVDLAAIPVQYSCVNPRRSVQLFAGTLLHNNAIERPAGTISHVCVTERCRRGARILHSRGPAGGRPLPGQRPRGGPADQHLARCVPRLHLDARTQPGAACPVCKWPGSIRRVPPLDGCGTRPLPQVVSYHDRRSIGRGPVHAATNGPDRGKCRWPIAP